MSSGTASPGTASRSRPRSSSAAAGPSRIGYAAAAASAHTTAAPIIWTRTDAPAPAATDPPAAPSTAPRDHSAWNRLISDRPWRSCTRIPWAFMDTSVMASHTPNASNSAANTATTGENPTSAAATDAPTIMATATAPSERCLMRAGVSSPPTSAPAG